MIIVGTATVNASTGKVELSAPMGFGTARGVRLSNFTGDSLTLTNISGTDQSQEYLAPQTQMVYTTANIGAKPTAVGVSYPAETIANNLLVEWSTDPDADFIGTYPAALPAAISNNNGASLVASKSVDPATLTVSGITVPGPQGVVAVQFSTTGAVDAPYALLVEALEFSSDGGLLAGGLVTAVDYYPEADATVTVMLPFNLSHMGELTIGWQPPAECTAISYQVYSLTNTAYTLPLFYVDISSPLTYSTNFTPDASGGSEVLATTSAAANIANVLAATFRYGLVPQLAPLRVQLLEVTSGTGLSTPGILTFNNAGILANTGEGVVLPFGTFDYLLTDVTVGTLGPGVPWQTGGSDNGTFAFLYGGTTDTAAITVEAVVSMIRAPHSIVSVSQ